MIVNMNVDNKKEYDMKKNLLCVMMTVVMLCGFAQSGWAQTPGLPGAKPYFKVPELPNMLKWYPAPPDTASMRFKYDIAQYEWGKQQRQNPERAAIALRDAVYGIQTIMSEFSIPFGIQISPEGTPAIFRLLLNAAKTCDLICKIPKNHYMRVRPFMLFNEPTFYPKDDEALRKNGSYPSGHTILGWSAALLLSEINPERADTLLARGMMYGESRVIVGAHWQSDVDAAFVAASVAYDYLHTSDRFNAEMRKAKREFKRLKRRGLVAK